MATDAPAGIGTLTSQKAPCREPPSGPRPSALRACTPLVIAPVSTTRTGASGLAAIGPGEVLVSVTIWLLTADAPAGTSATGPTSPLPRSRDTPPCAAPPAGQA